MDNEWEKFSLNPVLKWLLDVGSCFFFICWKVMILRSFCYRKKHMCLFNSHSYVVLTCVVGPVLSALTILIYLVLITIQCDK